MTVDPIYGCHLWEGKVDKDGYPTNGWGRAYSKPAPKGMEWDHVCRRKRCMRHLELVTKTENLKRMSRKYRWRSIKCHNGHEYYSNSRITPEGGKVCLVCWPLDKERA